MALELGEQHHADVPGPNLRVGLDQREMEVRRHRAVLPLQAVKQVRRVQLEIFVAFDRIDADEQWVMRKVSEAFRRTISNAIIAGDGNGRPLGIMHPNAGIPVCETAPSTPPGEFRWQDLAQLKAEVPPQWAATGAYWMNSRTFALLSTMSDASGRPLLAQLPQGPQPTFWGSPIHIVTQLPDVGPGTTPILFGDMRAAYLLVTRAGTSMQVDPFTAGWCLFYRFETRVGGAPTCSNAARWLRIR